MSTPPKHPIDTAIDDFNAKMVVAQQMTALASASISASHSRASQTVGRASLEMLITPARSYSGLGRFADVMQVMAWVAENTTDYAITQRDRKDGAGLRADDLIEFQIILSGDESEAVAFQFRWLGGSE